MTEAAKSTARATAPRAVQLAPWRWFTGLLVASLLAALAYHLHRAVILRVDQWDAFLYLNNALGFLSATDAPYQIDKPPVVPALYAPVMALAHGAHSMQASLEMLVWPHVYATLLSSAAMAAVFLALRGPLGWRLALVGVVLAVGNRVFMRYAPLALTDVVSAGLVASSFWLWWEARSRRRTDLFVFAGVSVGLAAASRYQFALIPFAIAAAEVLIWSKKRRVYDQRWRGLALTAGLSGLVFVLVHALAFAAIGREVSYGSLIEALEYAGAGARRSRPYEEPWHYLLMLWVVLSPLTLLSAVVGFGVGAYRRRDRDMLFAAWLVFAAVPLFRIDHNEIRYLYAAFPALIYFALLPAEELSARGAVRRVAETLRGSWTLAVGAMAMVAVMVWPGVDQVRRDTDPFFRRDVIRGTAEWLLAHTDEAAPFYWYGRPHTLHPRDVELLVHDEFFNVFNFGSHEFVYFTDRAIEERGFVGPDPVPHAIREAPGGCGLIVGTPDDFNTRELFERGIPDPPVDVIAITRVELAGTEGGYTGGDMAFRRTEDGLIAGGDYGEVHFEGPGGRPLVVPDLGRGSRVAMHTAEESLVVHRVVRATFPR